MGQHFSEQELALRHELATNFPRYAETCLKISSKQGDVQPFRLNRSQLFLHERLEQQRKVKMAMTSCELIRTSTKWVISYRAESKPSPT
jgi:hypothetical protein